MLVTLCKNDLIANFFNGDIEKFKFERETGHVKRPMYLTGIRSSVFSNFEAFFGLSLTDLTENYTFKGEKIDPRFLQKRVGNAVHALLLGKKEKDSHDIGEFERARRGTSLR